MPLISQTKCRKEETAYIDWTSIETKTKYCNHIQLIWSSLKTYLCDKLDTSYTVPFMYFEKNEHATKKGKVVERLHTTVTKATM